MAQNESRQHFHRCPSCNTYVCDACWNEDEGLCTDCAPRQEIYVAKTRADAMKRNIDSAGETATVWQGTIESKTAICPACGKPAGSGKFCNNCGTNLAGAAAPPAPQPGKCPSCGADNPPGTKFCGECGTKL